MSIRSENIKNLEITGIILAGGKSKRIGVNKALQKLGNERLIDIIKNKIKNKCSKIIISANSIETLNTYPSSQEDLIRNIGPLGGIYTCLKKTHTKYNLVVSCDTPFINNGLIEYLIKNIINYDVIVPKINNFAHPTIGIYSKTFLKYIEESISDKDYNLYRIIKKSNYKTVDIKKEHEFYNENLFFNINTQEDLLTARKIYNNEH